MANLSKYNATMGLVCGMVSGFLYGIAFPVVGILLYGLYPTSPTWLTNVLIGGVNYSIVLGLSGCIVGAGNGLVLEYLFAFAKGKWDKTLYKKISLLISVLNSLVFNFIIFYVLIGIIFAAESDSFEYIVIPVLVAVITGGYAGYRTTTTRHVENWQGN